jgi:hypothetical protein
VDTRAGTLGGIMSARGRGGAGTSAENNNVFTVQPTVYFEGMDPTKEAASVYAVRGGEEGRSRGGTWRGR